MERMAADNDGILIEIEESMKKLTKNDKIVINSLSFLADDYRENTDVYPRIVELIEDRVRMVPAKLPLLYLIDSILKNVGAPYIDAFSVNLVQIFGLSFEETQDPHSRRKLYDLRKTWVDVFPSETLFALDRRVNAIDPAWPVPPNTPDEARVIHINPKFLKNESNDEVPSKATSEKQTASSVASADDRRLNVQSEAKTTSRPLQLPLPPFYHDVPRPGSNSDGQVAKRASDGKSTNSSKTPSSSSLRDPRLQRGEADKTEPDLKRSGAPPRNGISKKRKLPSAPPKEASFSDEDMDQGAFLIDREGDESIEKKAAKKKAKKTSKKQAAMKKEDQDLRRVEIPLPPSLPSLPPPPVSLPQPPPTDVDMRMPNLPFPPAAPALRPMQPLHPPPPNMRPPQRMPGPPPRPHPPHPGFQRPPMSHPRPMRNGPRMPPHASMNRPMGPYGRPPMMNRPDMRGQGGMGNPVYGPPPPQQPQRPRMATNHGPMPPAPRMRPLKIDQPRWIVRIPGLDEMPVIGTDPRLLTPCGNDPNQAIQEVTINQCSYTLLLDRLQPMIQVDGYYHAVRFRVEYLEVVFRGSIHVRIPGNDSVRVTIGNKKLIVCIGGPHHELIIDGRPYSIGFGGDTISIPMKDMYVSVKMISARPRGLDVLPAIPTQILKWANGANFGPPAMLHLPPLNPIDRIEVRNATANISERDITGEAAPPVVPQPTPADLPSSSNINAVGANPIPVQPVNVFNLFEKLVKYGLVEKKEAKPKLDMDAFNLTDFLEKNEPARKTLYEGYQCTQCGQRYFNPESEEFTAHLDYHFISNNSGAQSGGKSRSYFETADMWLLGTCGPAGQEDSDSESGDDHTNRMGKDGIPTVEALPDDDLNMCSVCFEKFEIKYSDEEEAWLLINAVKKDGLFYHPICVEDAWKGVAVDMAVDPHLALKKVLEGKMEAVYKPDVDQTSSNTSEDGVQVIVKSKEGERPPSSDGSVPVEEMEMDEPEVKRPHTPPEEDEEPEEVVAGSNSPQESNEPKTELESPPSTPLQDEMQVGPSTPLTDETPFPQASSPEADLIENPETPVQDEPVESASNASSPGTPVRDEIVEPGTPVKDEPMWA